MCGKQYEYTIFTWPDQTVITYKYVINQLLIREFKYEKYIIIINEIHPRDK